MDRAAGVPGTTHQARGGSMKAPGSRRRLLVAAPCAVWLALVGCRKAPEAPSSTTETAKGEAAQAAAPARKVLVVGTDAAYAPFESQNERGEIVGFDIDVLKAVAAKAGIEVKFVNTPWE